MAQSSLIKRGQVWWVDFGDARGSEPTYRYPALVLQPDEVDRPDFRHSARRRGTLLAFLKLAVA